MLDWINQTVNALGYVGIALLMLLENIFPPIPSELIMPLAGFFVTRGELKFTYVVIAGVVGSILGALPWYYLGKYWGLKRIEKLADRYGKWLSVSSQDVRKAKQWFDRRGKETACFSRVIPGVRTYISIPAGISRMPLLIFLVYSTIGTTIWVGFLTYAGYLLGENYTQIKQFFSPISSIIAVTIVIFIIIWVVKRKRRS
ncbi:MAG: DedA family protein [Microcoleaceae cyanobacterium]